jgi:hypothetical protein
MGALREVEEVLKKYRKPLCISVPNAVGQLHDNRRKPDMAIVVVFFKNCTSDNSGEIKQVNWSQSNRHVLRGLHIAPHSKRVTCVQRPY